MTDTEQFLIFSTEKEIRPNKITYEESKLMIWPKWHKNTKPVTYQQQKKKEFPIWPTLKHLPL